MKHTYTKLAVAMLVAFSSASYAADVNFSNLSAGTVTSLTIKQLGTGKSRISSGNALTVTHTEDTPSVALGATAARGVTIDEAVEASGAFVHVGSLATLSLTQTTSSVNAVGDNNENTITGAMYTTGGSVTVVQTGDANAIDFALGVSGTPVVAPIVSVTQTGNDNQVELTRTAGTNTDTIAISGNSNAVKVTGASTGTNSVHLTLATGSDSNQVWVAQSAGSSNAMKVNVSGDSNVLDMTQSGTGGSLTGAVSDTGATVTGATNRFYLAQSGSANTATVDITGGTNNVDVIQSGATTAATLALTGNGNDVNITQSGAGTATVLTLASTGATVAVTQETAGASYTYAGTVPSGGSITVTQ